MPGDPLAGNGKSMAGANGGASGEVDEVLLRPQRLASFSPTCLFLNSQYPLHMVTADDVKKLALELPEPQRAALAEHLLRSLEPVLCDEDEGVAEALRRDAEMDADPSATISLEELNRLVAQRRQ